uniref:Uncharacterized protein n=1 Tax=Trichuris muris TaxID=70415 RepID=A0A5S6QLB1_TRIMR
MEAYAEKALGQHEVRLHEFRCHMLRQKRKPRPTELLPSTSPFTAQAKAKRTARHSTPPFPDETSPDCWLRLRLERKNCTVKLLVKNARITQVYTSVHCTPWKWNESFRKSNAFSMSGLRQCGLTNVVTYDWTSCYCMATVAPPMKPPQK